uniref:Uncharacterized protein n=1 Tax=Opuntia streptacantha TaxID=393608 RepID=A0A7C9ABT3_OPUST
MLTRRSSRRMPFISVSTLPWYAPPPEACVPSDPIISTISNAIKTSDLNPVKRILPSIKPHHIHDLLNLNPFNLCPLSLFSFFNWVSSHPGFRLPLHSYCAMMHFLCAHHLVSEAGALLRFVVSRKGKGSASSVFAAVLETKGVHQVTLQPKPMEELEKGA